MNRPPASTGERTVSVQFLLTKPKPPCYIVTSMSAPLAKAVEGHGVFLNSESPTYESTRR